ncbi:MAG: tRNA pseudouridine(38-40) synthase TruA [Syntrophobacteraceae bacterium]|nr:tRNA pseudouridine(38-40) synthase TruA [Desulfobacteraceae bacterium]
MKRNFKLTLEYDGSQYHGWQRQQGVLSIQEVLESRLEVMLGAPVSARASGRTDAGVHARGQVVSFYSPTKLHAVEIQRGLNSLLPQDIVVLHAEEVPDSFHARFSATSKIYEYLILNRPVPSALERRFSWHIRRPLDTEPIVECLGMIEGCHDFTSFMAAGSSVSSTERWMFRAEVGRPDGAHLTFVFEANGFLRHMVRNLVGTLAEVGKGKMTPRDFSCVLAGRDRRLAGMTAPAHGLYLLHVNYEAREVVETKGRDVP